MMKIIISELDIHDLNVVLNVNSEFREMVLQTPAQQFIWYNSNVKLMNLFNIADRTLHTKANMHTYLNYPDIPWNYKLLIRNMKIPLDLIECDTRFNRYYDGLPGRRDVTLQFILRNAYKFAEPCISGNELTPEQRSKYPWLILK